MKIYLAGIGGTFMTGLARLMKESGIEVSGCDTAIWPPMSDQLAHLDITPDSGWKPQHLRDDHFIIVGNVLSRGNPLVEEMLNRQLPFNSGPQWLGEHILADRQVLAVAGTHGKTTTTGMLAWILDYAALKPGFLLGGIAENFSVSARLGNPHAPFVIEADEYDTAFFDKRPKFIHYRPQILILSNLEFDHADIYSDIEAIKRQFHYLVRTVPGNGRIIYQATDPGLQALIDMGVWTPCDTFDVDGEQADWTADIDTNGFELFHQGNAQGICRWNLPGAHNVANAVSAIAAAYHLGVAVPTALRAMEQFEGISRRLEIKAEVAGVTVYDDFAHHPTEINASLSAVKSQINGQGRVLAVFEPRSNSMQIGVHNKQLPTAFAFADKTFFYKPPALRWEPDDIFARDSSVKCFSDTDALLEAICAEAQADDRIVVMSNGAFESLPERIGKCLSQRQ